MLFLILQTMLIIFSSFSLQSSLGEGVKITGLLLNFTAMQYIRLSALRQQFPGFQFPLEAADTDRFREAAHSIVFGVYETEQWILLLSNPANVLFMEWVEQEPALEEVLTKGELQRAFQNKSKLKEHALFAKFQTFITPFLYPKLDKALRESSMEIWATGLTFAPLLEEKQSDLVQGIVYEQLKEELEMLERNIARADSEEALVKAVQPYLKPSFLEMLNGFTKSFYRAKTNWMEALLGVSSHRFSSKRLVLHISGQLNRLELNPDHVKELRALDRDIKSGIVEVEATYIPWKRIVFLSVSAAAIIALVWFIWSVPTEPELQPEMENKTAYMAFTEAERKTMDSLLNQVTVHQQQQPENMLDAEPLPYVGITLEMKEPWKNKLAAGLFVLWESQDSTSTQPQPSESKKDDRAFPSTQPVRSKPGVVHATFMNETEQTAFVMVFDDRNGAPVYSGYVEKKAQALLRLNPGEYLFVLPGTKVPAQLSTKKLPFEQVDSRFFTHMHNSYSVDDFSPSKAKLVWKEVNSVDFYLLDLNGALNK